MNQVYNCSLNRLVDGSFDGSCWRIELKQFYKHVIKIHVDPCQAGHHQTNTQSVNIQSETALVI